MALIILLQGRPDSTEAGGAESYEAPFNFFDTNSFETVGSDYALSSPARGETRFGLKTSRGPDIALPELKHDVDESDYSLGDISPIKLPHNSSDESKDNNSRDQSWYGEHHFHTAEYTPGAVSNPFYVIRSSRRAFENCKYRLTCLRHEDVNCCAVNISYHGHIRHYKGHDVGQTDLNVFGLQYRLDFSHTLPVTVSLSQMDLQSIDWTLARRRVETAVIAFGGHIVANCAKPTSRLSIFRHKNDEATKQVYQHRLPHRYQLSGSAISWEVEESPPIHISSKQQGSSESNDNGVASRESRPPTPCESYSVLDLKNAESSSMSANDEKGEQPKLKYRCKRCGQLKQNHECPYRQCLHRSIGVMVYPAVNSFTAAEPGHVAPALTKMNNFVSYDSDQGSPRPIYTPLGSLPSQAGKQAPLPSNQVSPESFFGATNFFDSPQSSLSNHSDEAMTGVEAHHSRCKRTLSGKELVHAASLHHSSMFIDSVCLRPEHYRAITPLTSDIDAYQYPSIPLTFAERKRLADTLFHLSNEIPELGADVANILHKARLNNEWDLCVAELLTQIVVAMYCSEGDLTLDGLQQYLLILGISC